MKFNLHVKIILCVWVRCGNCVTDGEKVVGGSVFIWF